MPNVELYAGALCLLIRHDLTGCALAARQAASLLDRLADLPGTDGEIRCLCETMAALLVAPGQRLRS